MFIQVQCNEEQLFFFKSTVDILKECLLTDFLIATIANSKAFITLISDRIFLSKIYDEA